MSDTLWFWFWAYLGLRWALGVARSSARAAGTRRGRASKLPVPTGT
jgi:hypothetical protein